PGYYHPGRACLHFARPSSGESACNSITLRNHYFSECNYLQVGPSAEYLGDGIADRDPRLAGASCGDLLRTGAAGRRGGHAPARAPHCRVEGSARQGCSAGAADVPGEQVAEGAVQVAAAAVIASGGARRGVPAVTPV